MVGLVFCFTFSLCARASLHEVFFFFLRVTMNAIVGGVCGGG